jgi:hypothetical protein
MNTNFRAILFGTVVAAAMFVTIDSVVAAEQQPEVIRLDGVTVTAHNENFDADGNLKVIQLEGVTVTGRK